MDSIKAYRIQIQQATSREEKGAIAAELHQLATTFDDSQRADYEKAMDESRAELMAQIPAFDAAVQRVEAIMAAIEARQSVRV